MVVALIAIELVMFTTFARREITWAYPGYFDQTAYLAQSYTISRDAATDGLVPAIRTHLAKSHATGILLPIQGAIHGVILGPGRMSALSVNLFHFALFQCVFVSTLLWLTRNWWVALSGLGLTLTLKTVFQPAGGAFDFRMDFVSFCLFGVFLCAIIRSRVFFCPKWSAVVGAIGVLLVLFRFITAIYLVGILGLLGSALCVRWFRLVDAEARRHAKRRIFGWWIAIGILLMGTLPVLHAQRNAIRDYYVTGHITSNEKDIRAAEEGINQWRDRVVYYPHSITHQHTGEAFWWAAGGIAVVGLFGRACSRNASSQFATNPTPIRRLILPVTSIAFLVPFIVLNLNAIKSPVVGIIFLPPLLWAVLAPIATSASLWNARPWLLRGVAILILLGGFLVQLNFASTPLLYTRLGEDGLLTMRVLDDLTDACNARKIMFPELFVDSVSPEFNRHSLQLMEYERSGRWREFGEGTAIFAGEEEEHLKRLARSDVVILGGKPEGHFRYPYDLMMDKLRPRLEAYCEVNLIKVGEYRISGRTLKTYVRRHLHVEGATRDGWITDKGVQLVGTLADLQRCRQVELHRAVHPNLLGRNPGVTAHVHIGQFPPRPLPASVLGDLQIVQVEWQPVELPPDTPVRIELQFDSAFVPREKGMGSDPRALVMSIGPKPRVEIIKRSDASPKE